MQPPDENGASNHEDRQCAEAPSDPAPLSDEKTELLLEEREHRDTEYSTPVHFYYTLSDKYSSKNSFASLPSHFLLAREEITSLGIE